MVTIYTTETCPKCKILKKKMEMKKIPYEECADMEIMQGLGIMSVPYLKVNEVLLDFSKANQWIETQE